MIGSGGFGQVFAQGEDVVKRAKWSTWNLGDELIIREAAALQVLQGVEGVIGYKGLGFYEGRPFVRLPRIRWPTLAHDCQSYPATLRTWLKVVKIVKAMHKRGVIHRDLKPDSVFMVNGEPLVFDLNLAWIQGQAPPDLWDHEAIYGTPPWIPPWVLLDDQHDPVPEDDVYQLGALLHWCSEGTQCVEGIEVEDIFRNAVSKNWTPIREDLERARTLLMRDMDLDRAVELVEQVLEAAPASS